MFSHRPVVATIALTVCLVCSWTGAASGSDAASRRPGQAYALLVGTGSYEHWDDLANPVPDVRAVAEELETGYGFEVETLENPTKAEILLKLRGYHDRTFGPQDQLLVFFAGHGHFDELSETGYLVARDTELPRDDRIFETFLEYPKRLIDRIPVQHILLVADACFAGTLDPKVASHRGADAIYDDVSTAEYLSRRMRYRTRRYLTSGGKEYVSDGRRGMHSPFTRRLLEGLRSYGGGDGVLSLTDLFSGYLDKADPQPRWNEFGSNEPGSEFFFIADATLAPAPPAGAAAGGPPRGAASSTPTVRLPSRSSAEPAALRGAPDALSQQQLEAVVRHKGFRDSSWNPDGDFPNRFEEQMVSYERIVVDRASGLMWQAGGSAHRLDWPEVADYVTRINDRTYAGHADWRLPTIEELASLIEPSIRNGGLFLDPVFEAEQEECWSADRNSASGDRWHVRFTRGHVRSYSRGGGFYVRLVRSLGGHDSGSTSDSLTAD